MNYLSTNNEYHIPLHVKPIRSKKGGVTDAKVLIIKQTYKSKVWTWNQTIIMLILNVKTMRTKTIKAGIVAAFALIAGYTVYNSQKEVALSDIAMENVEALAVRESNRGCTADRNAICETSHNDYPEYRNN